MNAKFDTTYRAWPLGTLFFWDSVSLFIKLGSLETEPHNGYSMNTITRKDFFYYYYSSSVFYWVYEFGETTLTCPMCPKSCCEESNKLWENLARSPVHGGTPEIEVIFSFPFFYYEL